jgi:hypothetical protein
MRGAAMLRSQFLERRVDERRDVGCAPRSGGA